MAVAPPTIGDEQMQPRCVGLVEISTHSGGRGTLGSRCFQDAVMLAAQRDREPSHETDWSTVRKLCDCSNIAVIEVYRLVQSAAQGGSVTRQHVVS
jgi:hypothetical protein